MKIIEKIIEVPVDKIVEIEKIVEVEKIIEVPVENLITEKTFEILEPTTTTTTIDEVKRLVYTKD